MNIKETAWLALDISLCGGPNDLTFKLHIIAAVGPELVGLSSV